MGYFIELADFLILNTIVEARRRRKKKRDKFVIYKKKMNVFRNVWEAVLPPAQQQRVPTTCNKRVVFEV